MAGGTEGVPGEEQISRPRVVGDGHMDGEGCGGYHSQGCSISHRPSAE